MSAGRTGLLHTAKSRAATGQLDWAVPFSLYPSIPYIHFNNTLLPNFTILLRNLEASGFTLSPESSCPGWGISWFSSITPSKTRDCTSNYTRTVSFHNLHNSLFTNYPNIQHRLFRSQGPHAHRGGRGMIVTISNSQSRQYNAVSDNLHGHSFIHSFIH